MRRSGLTKIVLGLFAFAGCGPIEEPRMGTDGVGELEQMLSVCAAGTTVPGIDVSHWDGAIVWSQVAGAGIKWGYAKATESTNYTDPTFATNWSGMKANGVFRGAYHFFHPNLDGKAQADYFLGVVGTLAPGDLPPMLDWEVSSGATGGCSRSRSPARTPARSAVHSTSSSRFCGKRRPEGTPPGDLGRSRCFGAPKALVRARGGGYDW